ncbi:MAG: histidine phosphatase family protein, partial [Nocardioidaceae bacterium]
GIPLTRLTYFVDRPYPASKHVSYWTASARDADTDSPFVPNDEVDDIDWLSPEAAAERLTYHRDRGVLDDFVRATRAQAHHSRPLVILRHAAAEPRRQWPGPDATRPLTKAGRLSAEQLVPALGAYGIKRIVSSDASRCIETVEPYANERDRPIVLAPELSEDKATRSAVTALAESWRERHRRVVLCTHRPVLPWVFDALGLPDPALPPGGIVVAHRLDGVVVAVESPAHGGA